jgi:serine protease AprX
MLETLANDPDIAYISPNRSVSGMLDISVAAINALAPANLGMTGLGIGVAVIDSGISQSVDMQGVRLVYQESFLSDGVVADLYGHGTHVAGIIGGTGQESGGLYTGVAPGVSIVNLRVLDQNGNGTDSDVIAAIQRAIQLQATYNIRVINLSLGRPVVESYTLDPLCQAVEAAWQAGIVVVAAAGNDGRDNTFNTNGYGTIGAPGNDPFVITVGAIKTMGTTVRTAALIASYSSKGPTAIDHIVKPDLVAPGNLVVSIVDPGSTLDVEYPGNEAYNGDYFTLSGTSMATPMVSGAAALMLQNQPGLTPGQVKARLMKTASKQFPPFSVETVPVTGLTYTSYYDVFTVGAGYIDVGAALKNTDLVAGDALSPTAVFNPSAQTLVPLGTASAFGVLGASTVTNTGATVVNGNLGVSPGTAVTGFLPGIVTNGAINAGNAVAAQAKSDLTAAFRPLPDRHVPAPCCPETSAGPRSCRAFTATRPRLALRALSPSTVRAIQAQFSSSRWGAH